MARFSVWEGFEDPKSALREPQCEPWARQRFPIDAGVDVRKELPQRVLLSRFGLQVDVIGLMNWRVVDSVHKKTWVIGTVLRHVRRRHRSRNCCLIACGIGGLSHRSTSNSQD